MTENLSARGGDRNRSSLCLPPHPNSCGLEDLKKHIQKKKSRPFAIDLFSGAGGLSLGLERAGFEVILGVDLEKHSIATHRAYFGGCSQQADLSDSDTIELIAQGLSGIKVSLVAAGPPCQSFSIAGRGKIRSLVRNGNFTSDPKRELWTCVVEIVKRVKPRAVLVENVPGMVQGEEITVACRLIESLNKLGYDVYAKVLSSKNYGVPQYRERVFIVAMEPGTPFNWPAPARRLSTLRDCISDLPPVEGGRLCEKIDYEGPRTPLQRFLRIGVRGTKRGLIYDHCTRATRPDDLEAYRLMDHRTRYSDLPDHLRRYRSDVFNDKYKRLNWDGVSRTITAHLARDGYGFIHPVQHRSLTVREAARIQTFPDWFRFSGSRGNAYSQIGNAVPPLLATAIGRSINKFIKQPMRRRRPPIKQMAGLLVRWLGEQIPENMFSPWRKKASTWLALLGEELFTGAESRIIKDFWDVCRGRWSSPAAFLLDTKRRAALRALGREGSERILITIAEYLSGKNSLVSEVEYLSNIGYKSPMLSILVAYSDQSRTFKELAQTPQVLRIAGRVLGENNGKKKADAQMTVACLLGSQGNYEIYAALLEIGDRYCLEHDTKCAQCPLSMLCLSMKVNKTMQTHDDILEKIHDGRKKWKREEVEDITCSLLMENCEL